MKISTFIWETIFLLSISYCVEGDEKYRCPAIVRETRHYVATHKQKCFMFMDMEKYWDDARNYCWEKGGDLVSIPDAGTMNFLKKSLRDVGWRNNGVWIGAHDRSGNGWKWSTGERMTYSYWKSGKPSKFLGLISFEDCAAMRRRAGWRWDDHFCHQSPFKYNFICQFPFENSHIPANVEETPANAEYHASMVHNEGTKDSKNIVITAVVVSLASFLIILMIVIFFLYRRRKQKAAVYYEEPPVRFDNVSYSQVNRNRELPAPPNIVRTSCIEANEVNNLYEEVHKHFSYGVNQLEGGCACASTEGDAETIVKNNNEPSAAKVDNSNCEDAKGDDHYIDMAATGSTRASNIYVEPTKPAKPNNLVQNPIYANQEPLLPKRENVPEEPKKC